MGEIREINMDCFLDESTKLTKVGHIKKKTKDPQANCSSADKNEKKNKQQQQQQKKPRRLPQEYFIDSLQLSPFFSRIFDKYNIFCCSPLLQQETLSLLDICRR